MSAAPLVLHHAREIEAALVRRGVAPSQAASAARGVQSVALVFDAIDADMRDRLGREASRAGLDCLTGTEWALLAGGVSRLAGLARPGASSLPEPVAHVLGSSLAALVERPRAWNLGRGSVPLDGPVVVGILNVTPDSFSDGGRYLDPDAALRQAEALLDQGAAMLDLGAESTRPGRPTPVSPDEEWERLEPVLAHLITRFPDVPVSVDTVKEAVARRSLEVGAWAINDVSGLRLDPGVADVCAEFQAGLILMHSRGTVADMATYDHAQYDHVGEAVVRELTVAARQAERRGVASDRIVVDPGLGFAKTPAQTLAAMRDLRMLASLGYPVMVGPSRKRFLGTVTGREVDARDGATAAACVTQYLMGAVFFRVHAVGPTHEALAVAHAVRSA